MNEEDFCNYLVMFLLISKASLCTTYFVGVNFAKLTEILGLGSLTPLTHLKVPIDKS